MDLTTLLFGPEFLTLAINPLAIAGGIAAAGSLFGGGGGDEREQAAQLRQRAAGIGEGRVARARELFAANAPIRREYLQGAAGFGDPTNPFNRAPADGGANILQQIGALEDELMPMRVPMAPDPSGWRGQVRLRDWAQQMQGQSPYMSMGLDEIMRDPARATEEAQRQQRINRLLGFGIHS